MQSHLIFSLITKGKIVISVLAAVIVLSGCKREKQTVFTDTVYASGTRGSSVSWSDSGGTTSQAQDGTGEMKEQVQDELSGKDLTEQEDTIFVFVCGAVNCEGVYELPESARVIDAVEAAGGYSEEADRIYVNQAEYVYDTQRVEIPTIEEAKHLREIAEEAGMSAGDSGSARESDLIDINTADKAQLMKIPGIGENKADRIIEYRQIHGRFGSCEELMNVSGIGSGMYEKMKDCITVK